MHATNTGAEHESLSNDWRADDGCVNVDKNAHGRVDIAAYVPERVREMSNVREEQFGCDGGRHVHGSGSSADIEDPEGSGNKSRSLVVLGTCIPPMRYVAEGRKLLTDMDVVNAGDEEEQRRT